MFYNPEQYKIMVTVGCNPSHIKVVMSALSDEYLWRSGNSLKDFNSPRIPDTVDIQYLYINTNTKRLSYGQNATSSLITDNVDIYTIDEFVRRKIWRYI